jgi:phosphocarrier protein
MFSGLWTQRSLVPVPGKPLRTTVVVANAKGIHARPSSIVVSTARKFSAEIHIHSKNGKADAKKLLDVLSLGMPKGTELTLETSGPDAEKALLAMKALLESQFPFD